MVVIISSSLPFIGPVTAWAIIWDHNEIEDSFNGKKIRVLFDNEAKAARIVNEEGLEIPSYVSFWFAWAAFHTKTEVFIAK